MVLGVCRRVLRDPHDAEDAFQATLLVLVRKAASVVPREQVGNWLHGVAYRTALKARTARARRRKHERRAHVLPCAEAPRDPLGPDLRALLDQQLQRVPAAYRAPIVLCDLEGRTKREAARQLGIPEGTLSSRLARGRTLLRARLARRGIGLSLGSLAATLAQPAASAGVPAPLVAATIGAASRIAAGQAATGAVSANVAALTEGMVRAMGMSKLKAATAVLLAVSVLGLGIVAGAYRTPAAEPAGGEERVEARQQTAPAPQRKGDAAAVERLPPESVLTLALVSLDNRGRLVVRQRITLPDGSDSLVTERYSREKVCVHEARGKTILSSIASDPALSQVLKEEIVALVAQDGQKIDPLYLRVIKEGTLIFVLPPSEPGASLPPPAREPQAPLPAPALKELSGPPSGAERRENDVDALPPALPKRDHPLDGSGTDSSATDVEELLYAMLKRDGRIRHAKLDYEIYIRRVQGRTLIDPIFKRKDAKGNYDIVTEAREADLRVDLKNNQLLIHMRRGAAVGEGGIVHFQDRTFQMPLPREFVQDAGKEREGTGNEQQGEQKQPKEVDVVAINERNFEIPMRIDPANRSRVMQVILYVSTDTGRTWEKVAASAPDQESFQFRAPADGLYWFRIATVDEQGRSDADISRGAPGLKVRVETDQKGPGTYREDLSREEREKQAEKDFKVGEFYRRAGHPGSAAFYYELVRRRHPGTTFAEKAAGLLRELRPARVGQIILAGNRKTPDRVILEQVPLFPGQVLNYPDLRAAEQNLERLDLFRVRPKVSVIDSEAPGEYKDILIQVEEK